MSAMSDIAMKRVLYLVAIVTSGSSERNASSPRISQLFKSLSENAEYMEALTKPSNMIIKNIDIDLETLNMSTFRSKIDEYSRALSSNMSDDETMLVKQNNTRRLAWIGHWWEYNKASETLVKNKLFDLMLQTIYMTRHKIKQIESDSHFDPEDTSYRIAFLHRKLRPILKHMRDILQTMKVHYNTYWSLNEHLIMHHQAAKTHVDFLYLWWVLIRLDERYVYRHGLLNTAPQPGKYIATDNG